MNRNEEIGKKRDCTVLLTVISLTASTAFFFLALHSLKWRNNGIKKGIFFAFCIFWTALTVLRFFWGFSLFVKPTGITQNAFRYSMYLGIARTGFSCHLTFQKMLLSPIIPTPPLPPRFQLWLVLFALVFPAFWASKHSI